MPATRILVPLDGSSFSEWALPAALGAANALDGALELVAVHESEPVVAGWPLNAEGVHEWLGAYLTGVRTRLQQVTDRPITTSVLTDHHVAGALERHAAEEDTTLIVMSTHGRGGLARAWLGSVADHIVRHGSAPVLLIRPDTDTVADLDAPPLSFAQVLVPVDGSERAERALPWATKLGGPGDAHYTILRAVAPPMNVQSPYLPHTIDETRKVLEEGERDAKAYLKQLSERLTRDGLTFVTDLQVGVRPATAILHYAERHPVDLIVLGTHGRGGLKRTALGSVADKVVRGAHVPVLLIGTGEHD